MSDARAYIVRTSQWNRPTIPLHFITPESEALRD